MIQASASRVITRLSYQLRVPGFQFALARPKVVIPSGARNPYASLSMTRCDLALLPYHRLRRAHVVEAVIYSHHQYVLFAGRIPVLFRRGGIGWLGIVFLLLVFGFLRIVGRFSGSGNQASASDNHIEIIVFISGVGKLSDRLYELPFTGVERVFRPAHRRKAIARAKGDVYLVTIAGSREVFHSRWRCVHFEARALLFCHQGIFRRIGGSVGGDDLDGVTAIGEQVG